jgi:hypothetical protein
LNSEQVLRWYKRGLVKAKHETNLENMLSRLTNIDIYFREFLSLDLERIKSIKYHRQNIINIEADESEQEDYFDQACHHKECHQINCKFE